MEGSRCSVAEALASWTEVSDESFADVLEHIGGQDAPPRESMGLVLDTSALVAAERRASSSQACCAELMSRVHLADTAGRAATRRAEVDGLAAHCPIVDFGTPIAKRS